MRRALLLLIVVALVLPGFAQKKKTEGKRELPDQVLAAQFIYVTGWHGDDHDWRTPSEERSAILRVQRAVQTWGRYRLVYYPDQADIMMVVRSYWRWFGGFGLYGQIRHRRHDLSSHT